MIVAIEGIDAAGKHYQVEALCNRLKRSTPQQFDKLAKHDFPHYETAAGGVVGRILRGEIGITSTVRDRAIIVQSVMVADRLEWMPLLVEFAQSTNNLLLLDRYKMSGVVYGAAEGAEAGWIRTVQSCLPDADLNVLLDISVDESRQRRPERRDLNETNYEKLSLCRDYYLSEFVKATDQDPTSYVVIDGRAAKGEITEQIESAILRKIQALKSDQEIEISAEIS